MWSALLERRERNAPTPIYCALNAGRALCHALFFTVQLIYHVTVVGLDPFQMVLVGTVLEATCFLCEVPTGVVADVYSRRLSVLIGFALMGCSYTLEGGVPTFWAALVSQVFWGVGYTFTTGADQAWIADEIGDDAAGPVFLRGRQAWLAGILAGTLFSMALGVINIQLPMVLAGVGMFALAGGLALSMPERRMRPAAVERAPFRRMRDAARASVQLALARPVVRTVIGISLIIGLAAEAFDRLSTPLVIERFAFPTAFGTASPVFWFGVSGVVGAMLALAAAEVFRRVHPAALGPGAPARVLAALAAVDAAAVVIFALAGNLWLAFGMLWTRVAVKAIALPVQTAWLNRNLDAASRATVMSMSDQANSLGQVAGGPALGWVGNTLSIRAALLGSALILSPTIALYRRLRVRDRSVVESAPTMAD